MKNEEASPVEQGPRCVDVVRSQDEIEVCMGAGLVSEEGVDRPAAVD